MPQRLALTTRPVQRQQQRMPRPFAPRVIDGDRLGLTGGRLVAAQREQRGQTRLAGVQEYAEACDKATGTKVMSISDEMMWRYYDLLSFCSLEQIAHYKKAVAEGQNPRDIKVAIAQEIVTRFHNKQAAEDALTDFVNRSKGGIPDDIAEVSISGAPMGRSSAAPRSVPSTKKPWMSASLPNESSA